MLIRMNLAIADVGLRRQVQDLLARPDLLIHVPRARKNIWQQVIREPADVLIVSQALLPQAIEREIEQLQRQPHAPAIVVVTEVDEALQTTQLLTAGCDAVVSQNTAREKMREVLEKVLEKRRRLTQRRFFAVQPLAEPRLSDFVSQSPGMTEFMNVVPRVVRTDSTLLIGGETGVGKERLANAIHAEGPRAGNRFVAINCGALPEHLVESELFGHVRGAFTGATAARRGWFEIAHQGTLFLDEIAEIPLHLQVKLLRVLQEQEIQPVGSEKSLKVDVRVIAASNRSLLREVAGRRFRQDLFYRLNVVTVIVPPLRDRREDIPALVQRHLTYLAEQANRPPVTVHPLALQALTQYQWPGNVRELNNVLERALLLCDNTQIALSDLAEPIAQTLAVGDGQNVSTGEASTRGGVTAAAGMPVDRLELPVEWLRRSLQDLRRDLLGDLERQYIEGVLIQTQGRIGAAARHAGLSNRSLYEKMQQLGLNKENFRNRLPRSKSPAERRSVERRNTQRRADAASTRPVDRRGA